MYTFSFIPNNAINNFDTPIYFEVNFILCDLTQWNNERPFKLSLIFTPLYSLRDRYPGTGTTDTVFFSVARPAVFRRGLMTTFTSGRRLCTYGNYDIGLVFRCVDLWGKNPVLHSILTFSNTVTFQFSAALYLEPEDVTDCDTRTIQPYCLLQTFVEPPTGRFAAFCTQNPEWSKGRKKCVENSDLDERESAKTSWKKVMSLAMPSCTNQRLSTSQTKCNDSCSGLICLPHVARQQSIKSYVT